MFEPILLTSIAVTWQSVAVEFKSPPANVAELSFPLMKELFILIFLRVALVTWPKKPVNTLVGVTIYKLLIT